MRNKAKLICGALCLLLCTACGTTEPIETANETLVGDGVLAVPTPDPIPEPESTPEPEPIPDPIADLMATMTLEEKVGQLFFVRVPADSQVDDVASYHLGGYILFGRDTADQTADSLTATIASYQENATIPLLIGVDEEGGTVVRVSSNSNLRSSKFLSPQKLYNNGGFSTIAQDAVEKTELLQSLGFNVNLAPVADVSTSASDFIYSRTLGQEATATATYVETVVAEMDALSMGSALKHFPGYGDNIDTHTGIAVDNRTVDSFLESDFLPFQAGVDTAPNTTSILVSHNIITAVDEGYPASLSAPVHDWLRQELGFDGVVMTDDLAMDAVAAYAEDGNVSTLAILAGNDMVITSDYRTQIPKTIEAVENGTLSMERVEEACTRVLRWKQSLGLI
ncbi:glycoside hydrolase family 3 N-terminal domain-containing protein [Bengtsoniella intestinalis]|uniref:glycoside hydrolase family 3 N-terminal domain-containing protein n=1 Tax=Bengtsoniella intestinalis TaxID=3073143 RepID=UPI00391F3E99